MRGDETFLHRLVVLSVVLTTVLVVSGLAIGTIASGASGLGGGDAAPPSASGGDSRAQNPAALDGAGDRTAVQRQLESQVFRQIRRGGIAGGDQADGIRDSLSDSQYEQLLERYEAVAAEADGENQSQLFRTIYRDQRAYSTAVDAYWATYLLFDLAKTRPDGLDLAVRSPDISGSNGLTGHLGSTTVQEFARLLEQRFRFVDENATRLLETLDGANGSATDRYAELTASVERSRTNVSETQAAIRERWLTPVSLSAAPTDAAGSFVDPIRIEGHLETTAGKGIANEAIRLEVGNGTYHSTTNETGWFAVDYRPTTVPVDATNVSVTYVPSTSSSYTRDSTTIPVSIEQVAPSVSLDVSPDRLRFNQTARITGRVGVDDVGASGVPYLLTMDGTVLARNATSSNGTVDHSIPLPATISPGNLSVTLSILGEDRAIASTVGETGVTVDRSPSNLSLSVDDVDGRSVDVAGRLTVPGAGGPKGEPIELVAGERTLLSTITGPNGSFDTTVRIPEGLLDGPFDDSSSVTIGAVYENDRANLGPSEERRSVRIEHRSWLPYVGALGVVFLVAVILALSYRWWSEPGARPATGPSGGDRGWPTARERDETAVTDAELLTHAHDALAADHPDMAVAYGYAALRAQLQSQLATESTKTPWEFYRAWRQTDRDEDVTTLLERGTELYERAVFAAEPVSHESVERLLSELDDLGLHAEPAPE